MEEVEDAICTFSPGKRVKGASPGLARIIADKLQYKTVKPVSEAVMEASILEEDLEDSLEAFWTQPIVPKTHGRLI